jgi:SAM-dependent methyltransferase
MSFYESQKYWRQRSDMLYYSYVDYIIRTVGAEAESLIDVGSGNCPYLDWFDWIPERVSVDIRVPYESEGVKAIKGDIHTLAFDDTFDICTCFQVLEHVPGAEAFAHRLLELGELVVVSVPYNWKNVPRPTPGHVHDPVTYEKLTGWMGREANYKIIVEEPFQRHKSKRLIALYDRDPERTFDSSIKKGRIIR